MNHVIPVSRRSLIAHDQPPSPDSLAKRFFVLAILGVITCIGAIVMLMLVAQ